MTDSQLQELKELQGKICIQSLGLSKEIFNAAMRIGTILMEVEFEERKETVEKSLTDYSRFKS